MCISRKWKSLTRRNWQGRKEGRKESDPRKFDDTHPPTHTNRCGSVYLECSDQLFLILHSLFTRHLIDRQIFLQPGRTTNVLQDATVMHTTETIITILKWSDKVSDQSEIWSDIFSKWSDTWVAWWLIVLILVKPGFAKEVFTNIKLLQRFITGCYNLFQWLCNSMKLPYANVKISHSHFELRQSSLGFANPVTFMNAGWIAQ